MNLHVLGLGRYKPVFNTDQEEELVAHILNMESRLFGFTLTEVRVLAYELAVRNNLHQNFNREKKMAGKTWLYSFLARHPKLRLRKPEATSIGRAIGFNRTAVESFFQMLTKICDKYRFRPESIWNVDETGITTVPNKQSKVISMRGKRQIGTLVSAERGTLITAEICMSASGSYMPAMLIFPRKLANPRLLDHTPPGTFAEYHPSGWIQRDIFVNWFKKFIQFTHPTEDNPLLLLLDGHAAHTKSIELINMARENNVVIICLPPHCTHRMQPLDVSFMAPLSTYYSENVRKWMRQNPGRRVTIYEVGKLFGDAFTKAATMETAINGFKKTGIYPLDPGVFSDWMYAPSETTERQLNCQEDTGTISNEPEDISQVEHQSRPRTPTTVLNLDKASTENISNESRSPESTHTVMKVLTPSTSRGPSPVASCSFSISPKEIFKIPKATRNPPSNKRKRGKAAVLTSSPYKAELEEELRNKIPKGKGVKKLNMKDNGSTKQSTIKGKAVSKRIKEDSDSSEEDDLDEACIYCNDLFSNSKSEEGWIKCLNCKKWSHEACSSWDENDDFFICDFCS